MNLPLIISKDDKVPLRRRLGTALIEAIESNRLVRGASLPSSRELATSTGISRATVVRVYEELVRTGYLESRGGGKTYVKESSLPSTQGHNAAADKGLDDKHVNSFARHLLEIDLSKGSSADQPTLFYGAPPKWALPLNDWKLILRKNCATLDPSQFEYLPHPFGSVALRSAVAQYLNRTHGLVCSPDQVLIFTNSQSPLNFIAQLFINKGDTAIVESPGHVGARNIFTACGANLRAVPIDDQGICIETLKGCIDKTVKVIYVTPSFHDPTGISMSLDRRRQLVQLAQTHNILLVEDAWDSDHSFISPHLPALKSIAKLHLFHLQFLESALSAVYGRMPGGATTVCPFVRESEIVTRWH
jgi:GntR family transcriptional regulator/MocR family aminotransferase